MPFAGSLAWRLKREISGFLGMTGTASTTAYYDRSVSGQANFAGNLSTRAFWKRSLTGSVGFTGTNDPAYVQLADVSGVLPAMNGAVSTVYTAGEAIFRRTLNKLGLHL